MIRLPLALSALPLLLLPAPDDPPERHLEMTKAVACRKINGYEDFEPLDEPKVTNDEKLLIYYRPLNYEIKENKAGGHLAHFKQDVKVRKRGEKKVLWVKDDLLDFEATSPTPPVRVYLTNSISVKGFPPGDYDLDMILRDALKPGATATQTLRFTVVPTPKVENPPDAESGPKPDEAPPRPAPQPKAGKKVRRPN